MKKEPMGRPLIAFAAIIYATAFSYTLKRVRNLLAVYISSRGTSRRGRSSVHQGDVLRAATVLLHAGLEDLLRGIAFSRIGKGSPPEVLDRIPLLGTAQGGEPKKFWLGTLAPHADKKVEELINESVHSFYRHSVTFNNRADIVRLFQACGLSTDVIEKELPVLDTMIQRRHSIVHHGDRDPRHLYVKRHRDSNRGYQVAKSLSAVEVDRWVKACDRFAKKALEEMSGGEHSKVKTAFQQRRIGYRS